MKTIINIHNRCYSYQAMEQDLHALTERYSALAYFFSIGETADHRQIYCLRIGKPEAERTLLIQGAMHGREWKNTQLLLMMAERFMQKHREDILWEGIPYRQLLRHFTIYIVPMLNPDGVQISQFGREGITDPGLWAEIAKQLKPSETGRYWKANALGVDLNRNYESGFGGGDSRDEAGGACYPGEMAGSEQETRALIKLLEETHPDLVVNYHSAGQEIFYRRYFTGLEHISRQTGYPLVQETMAPYGSLGDWLTEQKIDWCTLETGIGRAPVWHMQIYLQWIRHRDLLPLLLATAPQRG